MGSLLRPPELLAARESGTDLKAAEDRAIREVVAMQEEVGLEVVTDGEYRRESFQSELTAAIDGFEGVSLDAWLWGEWHSDELGDKTVERPEQMAVVRPLERRRSLAAEEFTFLRSVTDRVGKITLPSPSLFANLWDAERSRDAYPSFDDFMTAVVGVFVDEVRELAAARLPLRAARRPALPAAGRSQMARVLRGARLERRELDRLRHRAGQRSHRRCPGGHVRLPPLQGQPGQPLAGVGRLRRHREARVRGRARRTGCCSSTTTSAAAGSSRWTRSPRIGWWCSGS